MSPRAQSRLSAAASRVAVGIDVGGPARGFHAVALRDGVYVDRLRASDTKAIAAWCRELGAHAVGVDAPCRWSATGRSRLAERELMAEGIHCFFTPSRQIAESHPTGYFSWMTNGMAMFAALRRAKFELFDGVVKQDRHLCFETFPQAIACALSAKTLSAKHKRRERRALLERNGIDTASLTNIDWIDAALCALTADCLLQHRLSQRGDVREGFIVQPRLQPRLHPRLPPRLQPR